MVKKIELKAEERTEQNGKAGDIRAAGFIPAVLYGSGGKNYNLKVGMIEFEKAFSLAGETSLIDLDISGRERIKVIVKDLQRDAIRNGIKHVDFYRVNMKKKLDIEIPLNFIGEAAAVKELGGTLLKNLDTIEVKCFPGDLVEKIDVDLSVLKTFDDAIKAKDIKLPPDYELENQPEELVAAVTETEAEEEPAAPAAEGAAAGEEKKEAADKGTAAGSGKAGEKK